MGVTYNKNLYQRQFTQELFEDLERNIKKYFLPEVLKRFINFEILRKNSSKWSL